VYVVDSFVLSDHELKCLGASRLTSVDWHQP